MLMENHVLGDWNGANPLFNKQGHTLATLLLDFVSDADLLDFFPTTKPLLMLIKRSQWFIVLFG